MTDRTDDFDLEITEETCLEQSYRAVIKVKKTSLKEILSESPEIDEIQAMQGEEVKEVMEGAAETTSCKDRMKREYYTPENVRKDLWEFTEAAGLNHPTQLNTGNMHSKGRPGITCSNGEPEVKGLRYLSNATIAFGYLKNQKEANSMISAMLKELKKIAGFELRENIEYYSPENILHDLEAFTEALGLKHPTEISTNNIRQIKDIDGKTIRIKCNNGETDITGQTYLRNALKVFKEKYKDDENKKMETLLDALNELKEIAGFEVPKEYTERHTIEYYSPENENVFKDLWVFTEALGLKHPTEISTNNIRKIKDIDGKTIRIKCNNGETDITGETYLRYALKVFKEKYKDDENKKMETLLDALKELKEIAGYKTKKINEVLETEEELPKELQEHSRKALEKITEIQNDTKSEVLACINTATFIKGEAFEQLVGVFLAYQYPEEKIIPQYCLRVEPENGYYGLRADYKVGHDIYEIKWGGESATAKIDECTEKQLKHIQEGMNYKLISCVLNEKTKETFTPFLEEVKEKLKNDDCVEIFSSLTEKIKELADLDDTETLKKYRNAFFSIYMNAMDENNDRKEYIEEMMLDIATTANLDEFIEANELRESPANLDANFEYEGKLYQGKVLISKNIDEDAEEIEEEISRFTQEEIDDNLEEIIQTVQKRIEIGNSAKWKSGIFRLSNNLMTQKADNQEELTNEQLEQVDRLYRREENRHIRHFSKARMQYHTRIMDQVDYYKIRRAA